MHDRASFWSAPPQWPQAVLAGHELRVEAVPMAAIWLLSGECAAVLARHGVGASLGPRELCIDTRYALRIAPDRLLFASAEPAEEAFGWHAEGCALSDASDGMLVFDISGARAAQLMAQGCEYPFEATEPLPQESARMLFAGMKVIVSRRTQGWRLHVERAWAPALWHWLAAHAE